MKKLLPISRKNFKIDYFFSLRFLSSTPTRCVPSIIVCSSASTRFFHSSSSLHSLIQITPICILIPSHSLLFIDSSFVSSFLIPCVYAVYIFVLLSKTHSRHCTVLYCSLFLACMRCTYLYY